MRLRNIRRVAARGVAEHVQRLRGPALEALNRGQHRLDVPPLGGRVVGDEIHDVAPGLAGEALGRALDQLDAGMGVQVVQAGHHGLAPRVDDLAPAIESVDLGARSDRNDVPAVDRHRAVLDDAALIVHRHDGAAVDQDIDELWLFRLFSVGCHVAPRGSAKL